MTLCRAVLLLLVAVASTGAFAADPNSPPVTSSDQFAQSWRATLDSVPLVTWFTRTKRLNPQVNFVESAKIVPRSGPVVLTPGTLNGVSCLTMRTYKVKRQERFSDNESGFLGYSTCQLASDYQVRLAVGERTSQVPSQ
jgi:hypothetical protein